MNCRYCNTELKDGAKFCPNCGKEVLEYEVCISCGQHIKVGASFCPICGANQNEAKEPIQQTNTSDEEQSQQNQAVSIKHEDISTANERQEELVNTIQPYEQGGSSKGWLWIVVGVLFVGLIGGGYWYYSQSQQNGQLIERNDTDTIEELTDTIENDPVAVEAAESRKAMMEGIAELEIEEKISFIKEMYDDFFENRNFNTENAANLKKYLSPNVMERILIECPFEGSEGEKSFIVDCFRDGSLTYERPDYGDKVIKREIHDNGDNWFEVTNYWDAVETPVKVRLKIEDEDGTMKVVDFR